MKHFNFRFSFKTKGTKATGDGSISAETLKLAKAEAKAGVAKQFGGSQRSVVITSITELL